MIPFTPNTDGVWLNLPAKDYHAAPGVSQSTLKRFGEEATPAHFVESMTRPRVPTPEMEFGTVMHAAIFEPHNLSTAYYLRPETYPAKDRAKQDVMKPWHGGADYCKDWMAQHTDRPVITKDQLEAIPKIVASVRSQERFRSLLDVSQREVSIFKRDLETGLLLKCRCDCMAMDAEQKTFIGDLKNVRRGWASEDNFRRSVEDMGYDIQDASYRYVSGASHFIFCVAETEEPFLSAEYELDEKFRNGGMAKYRAMLNRYAECVANNNWPGYGPAKVLSPSRWYKEAA